MFAGMCVPTYVARVAICDGLKYSEFLPSGFSRCVYGVMRANISSFPQQADETQVGHLEDAEVGDRLSTKYMPLHNRHTIDWQ